MWELVEGKISFWRQARRMNFYTATPTETGKPQPFRLTFLHEGEGFQLSCLATVFGFLTDSFHMNFSRIDDFTDR